MIVRWSTRAGHVCRSELRKDDEGPRRRVQVQCLTTGCQELAEVFVGKPLRGYLALTPPEVPERRASPRHPVL
ncbi:MAG TPA: hypothetical protein VKG23_20645 [Thermoanaerobaculia bacterium]|nr:hypothetical protein [Thermoanaerobaculia bacterium]